MLEPVLPNLIHSIALLLDNIRLLPDLVHDKLALVFELALVFHVVKLLFRPFAELCAFALGLAFDLLSFESSHLRRVVDELVGVFSDEFSVRFDVPAALKDLF